MNIKNSILISSLALILSACSGLHSVDHKWCPVEEKPVVASVTMEEFNLSADALFKFDQSSLKDLLPEGKASLDKLADTLVKGYIKVNNIDLIGHTDRLGSAEYNEKLGLARANTVKAYLQSKGVTSPMTVSSKGELEPITSCAKVKITPELKACLQPDRRVQVKITGQRKQVN